MVRLDLVGRDATAESRDQELKAVAEPSSTYHHVTYIREYIDFVVLTEIAHGYWFQFGLLVVGLFCAAGASIVSVVCL